MVEGHDYGGSGLLRRARGATIARSRFVVRLAKGRKGSILAVVVLSVLAAIALYWARDTQQYVGNLLLNIGASFVGAVVTYALINPMMARAESREEKIHDHFNHATVIQHINDSKNTVRIFDTGIELLKDQYQQSFLAACRAVIKGGVRVEILLLDPDCRAAAQRAEELGSALDIRSLISENLRDLAELHAELNPSAQSRFEVRIYTTAPLASYYWWDQRALISFFPTDRSSVDTTQYETSVDSNFAQFVEQRFHESWKASYTLQSYFALPIKIIRDGVDTPWLYASWVILENRIYLAHEDLTAHGMASGVSRLQVYLDHVVPLVALRAGVYSLAVCDPKSPARPAFDRKYGPGKRDIVEALSPLVNTPLVPDQRSPSPRT